jgi:hypothetical protein
VIGDLMIYGLGVATGILMLVTVEWIATRGRRL